MVISHAGRAQGIFVVLGRGSKDCVSGSLSLVIQEAAHCSEVKSSGEVLPK